LDAATRPTDLDMKYEAPESLGPVDRFLVGLIKDERDLVIVHTALWRALAIPSAIFVYATGGAWWAAAAHITLVFPMFMARYVLMLHCVSHRRLFKRNVLNHFIPLVLGPLYGQTPYTYFAHHMGMHHPENNLYDDLSSTMKYQRDSKLGFLQYWADFFFVGMIKVPLYFARRKRGKLMRMFLFGEIAWYAGVAAGLVFAPLATFWVFVLPFLLIRVLMMCGNWAQHTFVDADDPNNAYKNSVTLTNARHNRRCFNDGYHVVHHIKPGLHWSEMPASFEENLAEYGRHKAIVFDGINNFQRVWTLVMRRDYDTLAEHMVDLPGWSPSHEEKVALLQARTRACPRTEWNDTPTHARAHARAAA
jgi:fatty acid desaturase